MILSFRGLMQPARGTAAVAVMAVFLLGVAAGSAFGPLASSRKAAANTPPLLGQSVAPQTENPPALRQAHPVQVVRVIDGDTFEARVNVWPGIDITTRVRLRGIDAPEMHARCDAEQAKARAARDALAAML